LDIIKKEKGAVFGLSLNFERAPQGDATLSLHSVPLTFA